MRHEQNKASRASIYIYIYKEEGRMRHEYQLIYISTYRQSSIYLIGKKTQLKLGYGFHKHANNYLIHDFLTTIHYIDWVTYNMIVCAEIWWSPSNWGLSLILWRPKEGSHGKLPLLVSISNSRQPVLFQQAVQSPLRHGLVVRLLVPWVMQWHLEARAGASFACLMLVIPIRPQVFRHGRADTAWAANSTHLNYQLSVFWA